MASRFTDGGGVGAEDPDHFFGHHEQPASPHKVNINVIRNKRM
jgi:hypothetical protein